MMDRGLDPAREILVAGSRALAHVDDLEASLLILADAIATACEVSSAAFVVEGTEGDLEIVAAHGLDGGAREGLAEAIRRRGHPIAQTFGEWEPTFDVAPIAPGGPALRSHLPLIVTRGETARVVGVLALAHDHATEPDMRQVLEAAADLAAVAVERSRGD